VQPGNWRKRSERDAAERCRISTPAWKNRVSNENKFEYIIEFLKQGNLDAAAKEFEKVKTGGEHAAASMEKLTAAGEKVLAFFGAELVLSEAVNEFLAAERASTKLETALRSTGQATDDYKKELHEFIEELKGATTFSGNEITNVVAKLVALKAPKDYLKELTERTLDLSTLMDKDLNKAITAMSSALRGDFSIFKDLGFVFDENSTAGAKFTQTLEQLAKMAGGQAREAAKSLGGQFEALKKNIADYKEELGKVAVGALASVNSGLQSLFSLGSHDERVAAIEKEKEVYLRLADSVVKLIIEKKKLGEIDAEQAGQLSAQVSAVRASLHSMYGGKMSTAVNETLPNAQKVLGGLIQDLGKGDLLHNNRAAPDAAPPPPDFRAEREAALLELDKLQKQLNADTLSGYDRERAVVAENYIEQMEQINLLANRAGSSIQEREELEQKADKAREQRLYEISRKEEAENSKRAMEEYSNAKEITDAETELRNEAASMQLQGMEAQMFQVEADHEKRKRMISELKFTDEDRYIEMMALEEQLHQAQIKSVNNQTDFAELMKASFKDIERQGAQSFSQGLAGAMVDAFEEGDKAFQKFASNFLKQIANMILQAMILNALKSMKFGLADGGVVTANAAGGVHFAAAGMMGMSSGPTFFPKFNTIAGEAGREMLAVLARPNSEALRNGVAAQFGTVQGREMALVDGRTLRNMDAGGGAGGMLDVRITLGDGLEARIVNKAANVSVQMVTEQMSTHSVLSETTKRLVA
jgi:hypothetical protein